MRGTISPPIPLGVVCNLAQRELYLLFRRISGFRRLRFIKSCCPDILNLELYGFPRDKLHVCNVTFRIRLPPCVFGPIHLQAKSSTQYLISERVMRIAVEGIGPVTFSGI